MSQNIRKDNSNWIVRDLTSRLPDEYCKTEEEAEKWVSHLWQWHPNSRPKIIPPAYNLHNAVQDMLSVIEGALRISDLWCPPNGFSEEHAEEAKALCVMKQQFENIVKKLRLRV